MNRLLHSLVKTWLGGLFLHWLIAHFSFAIPGEILIETDSVLAFHHPSPSYPLHILILPKSKYKSIQDLPSSDLAFESGLFSAVNVLVQRFGLDGYGYHLIVNGGNAQDVDHLHFHLVSDDYDGDLTHADSRSGSSTR